MKRIHRATLLSGIAVAVIAGGLAGAVRHGDATAASTAIPVSIADGLQRAYRITVSETVPTVPPAVAADRAIAVAKENFGWAGSDSATAHFVTFTDLNWGDIVNQRSPGVLEGATVIPKFVGKPVWLVLLPNARIPLFGGKTASFYMATLCVFVDPASGAFLKAATVAG